MKRDILFKGKRVDDGEWVFGFLMQDNFIRRKISCLRNGKKRIAYSQHEIDPETVCQFTGLLDKNGKKIFEGDIIDTEKTPMLVIYKEGCFYCESESMYRLGGWETDSIEIIGNIHD